MRSIDRALRARRLEENPLWAWSEFEARWQDNYKAVLAFVAERGRLPRTKAEDPGERPLGKWVATQRQAYKRGKLPTGRVELLEAIPCWH